MADKKSSGPIFEEILTSDLLTASYLPFAYGLVNVSALDPGWVWTQLKADPWFSMVVYDDLEDKDDVVASSLDTRKGGVLAKARQVLPASDKLRDKKIAAFIEETLEGFFDAEVGDYTGLNAVLWEILDAIPKGVAIGEILWGQASDRVFIKDIKFKPQHLFAFGDTSLAQFSTASYLLPQSGPLRLRTGFLVDGVGEGGLLPENKFLVASFRPRHSNRWGSPLLKKVFWPSWFKRNGLKVWLRYLEKGSGTMVTRYHDGASDSEKNEALKAATAIVEEAAVALPKKFITELIEHVRQSLGESFEGLVDQYANNAIMRVVLGQTLTSRGSEGGGSRALGEVHEGVRADKIEEDAKFLMAVVNRYVVWPLTLFNFGPVPRPPQWVIRYDPEKDLKTNAEIMEKVVSWVEVPKKHIYEMFSIPQPAEGEEVVEIATPPPPGEAPLKSEDSEQETEFAEGSKKNSSDAHFGSIALEDGALLEARPIYDRLFERVIAELEQRDLTQTPQHFFDQFEDGFNVIAEELGHGLFASYLLGIDQVSREVAASFAEGDKPQPFQMGVSVKPREAIEFFRGKLVVKRKQFNKISGEARAAAFTVAGVYKEDVLESFKGEIERALDQGVAQSKVLDGFRDILTGAGHRQLGAFHLETVFRTNMQVAYGSGRRHGLEAVVDELPYWRYNSAGDDRVRPTHAALNGFVLPSDNAFWDEHYPPWGFSCRCTVTALASEPRGYNRTNPSGQGEILYERGIPLKAEVGTAVYDLTAGEFKGIPARKSLRDVIEAGAKRSRERHFR